MEILLNTIKYRHMINSILVDRYRILTNIYYTY